MDKSELRKAMLKKRSTLSHEESLSLSVQAEQRLMADDAWKNAGSVALYAAVRGEADTSMLMANAWGTGKTLYFPRCLAGNGLMDMVECPHESHLKKGAYGILEPDQEKCITICDFGCFAPDLVVVPGVSFDRKGRRLGFGGGYYDRLLGRAILESDKSMCLVGFAYSWQILDDLPGDAWDHPMHAVCTDKEFLWIA